MAHKNVMLRLIHYQQYYGSQLRWFINLKIMAISPRSSDETKQNLHCRCWFSGTSYPVGRDMCIWRKSQHAHHLPNLIQLSTFCLAEVLSCMSDGRRHTNLGLGKCTSSKWGKYINMHFSPPSFTLDKTPNHIILALLQNSLSLDPGILLSFIFHLNDTLIIPLY